MFNIDVKKEGRDYYVLHFLYDKNLIDLIKLLPKREYLANLKAWKVDALNLYNLILNFKGSREVFFNFGGEQERQDFITKYKKALVKHEKEEAANAIKLQVRQEFLDLKTLLESQEVIDFDYSKYLGDGVVPFRHQIVGATLAHKARKLLFAMGLGSGKSLASLLASEMFGDEIKKVIIIAPNSLKYNWRNEINKFTKGQKYYILNGKNEYTWQEAKYFITNFEYFSSSAFDFNKKIKAFGIEEPDMFIIDEIHKLNNTKSNRTKRIKDYFKNAESPNIVALTGTPITNGKLAELYNILNFLDPQEFSSKSRFFIDYCGMAYIPDQYGWVQTRDAKLEEMNAKLQHLMYRVKTQDVLKNLPEFRINKIYIDMTSEQQKIYQEIESGMRNIDWSASSFLADKKEEGKNMGFLELIGKLRQYTSTLKLDTVKDFITTLNEDGEKVVTFDTYINPLKELTEYFSHNSRLYYGGVDSFVRQSYVDDFQASDNKLQNLFMSIQSGNVGLTLTAACNLIMLGLPLTPSDAEQCYARIYRNGQLRPVTVYLFIVKDTIDEYIDNLLASKLKISMKVIDNEEYTDNSSESLVSELFSIYKKLSK